MFEDQIFRMATFIDRAAKGNDLADAAMDAKRWFINYDINAPAVNWLRNSGVTPFLSYSYRVVPLLAETAIMKPWKVAKWLAIFSHRATFTAYCGQGLTNVSDPVRVSCQPASSC